MLRGSQLEVSSNGENDLVFDVSSGQLVAALTSTQQGQFSRRYDLRWRQRKTLDCMEYEGLEQGQRCTEWPRLRHANRSFPEKDLAVIGGPNKARLVRIISGEEVATVGSGYTNFAAFNQDGTLVFTYTSGGFGVRDPAGKQYCNKEGLR